MSMEPPNDSCGRARHTSEIITVKGITLLVL